MVDSSNLFIEDWFYNRGRTVSELFTADYAFVNEELAPLYGVDGVEGDELTSVTLGPERHAGVLGNAGWLASQGNRGAVIPVQRGLFVLEHLLCSAPGAPPEGAEDTPQVEGWEDMTVREELAARTKNAPCIGCHRSINGVGFAFEGYDGLGRAQDMDNGRPVDDGGVLAGTDVDGEFNGATGLAKKLADSERVRSCVVKNWYRYGFGRTLDRGDVCAIDGLEQAFNEAGGDVRTLLLALTQTDAFSYRTIGDHNE